jgi:hypothetical protein
MPLSEDEEVVEALPAGTPDPAFGITVRLGAVWRRLYHLQPFAPEDRVEAGGELAVPVVQQDTNGQPPLLQVPGQVAGVLRYPGRNRVGCTAGEAHLPGSYLNEE